MAHWRVGRDRTYRNGETAQKALQVDLIGKREKWDGVQWDYPCKWEACLAIMKGTIAALLVGAVGRLFADEVKVWLPRWTDLLISVAVARLPEDQQEVRREEWTYDIESFPRDLTKFARAGGFVFAWMSIWLMVRFDFRDYLRGQKIAWHALLHEAVENGLILMLVFIIGRRLSQYRHWGGSEGSSIGAAILKDNGLIFAVILLIVLLISKARSTDFFKRDSKT
jgi:hypothetical protein